MDYLHDVSPGDYDVLIIGSGMGGGMAGRRLAECGRRVLFLERGLDVTTATSTAAMMEDQADDRLRTGLWPHRFNLSLDDAESQIYPALGCGVGGSTLLYSAALERLERHDVDDMPDCPHPTGGWPIRYDELVPFYAAAESLLRVSGTNDPRADDHAGLNRPPPMRDADAVLMGDLANAGLKPYRLHVGITYQDGCNECLGTVCARPCKSSSKTCGTDVAVARGATVLAGCEVVRIVADRERVSGVVYRQDGEERFVGAKIVILAAGALNSPALLLKSASAEWPHGLANTSGLVGRNLMFHADDWMAIWPSRKTGTVGPAKTISSRALYLVDGVRMGMLHSTGLSASYGNILVFLYGKFDRSRWRALRFIRPFLRIPAKLAEISFGSATMLAQLVEDLPYADNRIELDPSAPGGVKIVYRFRQELLDRTTKARAMLKKALGSTRMYWLRSQADLNWGHPMGTCCFGEDPANSVLGPDCKTHDLDNLYVVDSSFMPTGGGVNPSLTIAANALRVATIIDAELADA